MTTFLMILGWLLLMVLVFVDAYYERQKKIPTLLFVKTKEDTLNELDWHQRNLKAAYASGLIPQDDYIRNMDIISRLRQEAEHQ